MIEWPDERDGTFVIIAAAATSASAEDWRDMRLVRVWVNVGRYTHRWDARG